MRELPVLVLIVPLAACSRAPESFPDPAAGEAARRVANAPYTLRSDAEWRAILSPEQYRITRQGGTERAFTGEYVHTKTRGTYACVCCGEELFRSEDKFDSGTGWPSFLRPTGEGHVAESPDTSLGMVRTEVTCSRCGAHLGHVFPDGPQPTGLRYCINSAALELVPDE